MAFFFGVIIGLSLGLTGGGGSIFAVPLLIYGLGVPVHDALSVSLATVALTAGFGAAGAIRSGLLEYRAGLIFAIAGMLTAPIGVKASPWFSESTIVTAFAFLMIVVALSMWRRTARAADVVPAAVSEAGPICRFNPNQQLRLTAPCSLALAAAGIGSGILSGFFGIGGGFVIVPALTFLTQLDIHRAVATSLLVITLVGLSGVGAVLLEGRQLPWALSGFFVLGGFAGMHAGRLLARRIAGPRLQKLFALAMVFVAVFVLAFRLF
jgi:uncharacterized membrane protein YfcA